VGRYGTPTRQILDLATSQDAHVLTHPPVSAWPVRYIIWMSQPS
jgi:hypothetical protein